MTPLPSRALATLLTGWRDATAAPAYIALADRIRLLVLDGRISLAARLPAERELASRLGVSRTTVTAAYAELRDAGFLTSLRGSGSVARLPHRSPALPDAVSGYLDFSKATMPALPALAQAARLAAEQLPAYLSDSGFDPLGIPVLRQAIADRYALRGLETGPDQIMVTIGAQHAIALIARTVLARGDRALVENPSYPHAFEALKGAGARLVPVSVSADEGWDAHGLEQALQRSSPSLGYLMPDFHNPTGRSMPAPLRQMVLDTADRQGTTLVADETMAELSIDSEERTVPFAVGGNAVLVGSVGKTIWGGVRIGWIRADRSVIQRLVRSRHAGDLGTPILEQLVVANLLSDYDAILARRRRHLREGRDYLTARLAEVLPEWHVPHPAGGLTLWVNLGQPVSSQLALAARSEGLNIAAGPRFGMDGAFERFIRIPFSYSREHTDRAVEALRSAWLTIGRHPVAEGQFFAEVV